MDRWPAVFVLLLMAAATTWSSFLLVADARQLEPAHAAGGSCIGRERDALLAFKQAINDTGGFLESWQPGRPDCCLWAGITCSNTTGHVIQLDLGRRDLSGQISPSLLSLEHLEYLDLGLTSLTGPNGGVPKFLGSFKNLRHLDLSRMYFNGRVPPQLGNLSKLEYLDLSYSYSGMYSNDISWLTGLSQLVYLGMNKTNLSSIAADWPLVVNTLPSLEHLSLSECSLSSADQSLTHLNITNLQELDLSSNYFGHTIASAWFWNVTTIIYLGLDDTSMSGPFPNALGNMTSLQELSFGCHPDYVYPATTTCNTATMTVDLRNLCDLYDLWLDGSLSSGNITKFLEKLPQCPSNRLEHLSLGRNNMVGMMSDGLGQLSSLTFLDLSYNSITGSMPLSIGKLSFLENFDLSYNSITGSMPLSIGKLSFLENLDLSHNHLTRPIPPELGNCTSLQYISLSNNQLIGSIPLQINSCTSLNSLALSNNNITGHIPPWLGNSTSLRFVYLSSNNLIWPIPGGIPNCPTLQELYLSDNHLTGAVPQWLGNCTNLVHLSFSKNHLTGHVPSNASLPSNLVELDLSNNKLDGLVTEDLVTLKNLEHIDFSHNILSGPLPLEIGAQGLIELTLSFNYFSGPIPESICMLRNLLVLDLSDNFLEGELPWCSHKPNLVFLDLSHNRFYGKFPSALQNYLSLAFMDLSMNNFNGTLPLWIGDLVYLRFLQLSHNLLSGDIPINIANLTAMAQPGVDMSVRYTSYASIFIGAWAVMMKHQELKYGIGVFDVVSIDLSLNQLVGGIPEGITSLNGLLNLNLSWNQLSGKIPTNIGAMKSIESLDLSRNKLSGEIPSSLSDLTYLSSLDLSYNNLEGRIPPGSQLDTLYMQNASIYNGNIGLCGPPLERNCSGDNTTEHENPQRREKVYEPVLFFYFGLGSGFLASLWIVFCALLFKKAWRVAYFRLFDKVYDNSYVVLVVTLDRMKGKATS